MRSLLSVRLRVGCWGHYRDVLIYGLGSKDLVTKDEVDACTSGVEDQQRRLGWRHESYFAKTICKRLRGVTPEEAEEYPR